MTPYSNIYNRALKKIKSDPVLASLTDELLDEQLSGFLDSALLSFHFPKNNLWDKNDELQIFNSTLFPQEEQIIAELIAVEWLKHQIMDTESLAPMVVTNDYRLAGNSSLAQITNVLKNWEKRVDTLVRRYNAVNQDGSSAWLRR